MKKLILPLFALLLIFTACTGAPKQTLQINNSEHYEEDINLESADVTIGGNAVINGSIMLGNGELNIGNSVTVEGEIHMGSGNIIIGSNGMYNKDISIANGELKAENSNHFINISVDQGAITLGSNNTVSGSLLAPNGDGTIQNSNNIGGNVDSVNFSQGGNNVITGNQS